MMWVSVFGAFAFLGLTFWKRKSYPTNLLFLAGFTAMEAYSISVIVSFTDSKIVLQAVIFTFGIFVALSLFAVPDKVRLHQLGSVFVWSALGACLVWPSCLCSFRTTTRLSSSMVSYAP